MRGGVRWVVVAVYAAGMVGLSLAPAASCALLAAIFPLPHADKAFHVALYAVLAGLVFWARGLDSLTWGPLILVPVACGGFGLLLEALQALDAHGRTCSLADAGANAAGAAACAVAVAISRKGRRRDMRLIALCLVALLVGCETEGGGGGVTPQEEPLILESFTCREVDARGRPSGITELFSRAQDTRIYVWSYWERVEGTHTAQARWLDPSGSEEYRGSWEFTSSSGEQIVWFYIEPAGMELGRWEVELWLDGVYHRSHFFQVQE